MSAAEQSVADIFCIMVYNSSELWWKNCQRICEAIYGEFSVNGFNSNRKKEGKIMVRKTIFETKYDLRDGHGPVHFNHIMKGDELMGHGTMFAHTILPPGSSIGVHQHVGNTEPYYILKGTGIFTDADGSRIEVKAGDACLIQCGESHGMENVGDEDLEMIALIINEA